MTAIAESTPGPMAINSATYIGYRLAGIPGAALATLAVCIPSFVIIYLISLFFDRFLSLRLVACAFQGIQVCVVYLIGSAGWKMLKGLKRTWLNTVLVAAVSIGLVPVSYTHLDVYKRQVLQAVGSFSMPSTSTTQTRQEAT